MPGAGAVLRVHPTTPQIILARGVLSVGCQDILLSVVTVLTKTLSCEALADAPLVHVFRESAL